STRVTWTPATGRCASAMRSTRPVRRCGRCMTPRASECRCNQAAQTGAGESEGAQMADLADFEALVPRDHGLVVMTVIGPDGRIRSSVVNAGVIDHPVTGSRVVAVVIQGKARKLDHLRDTPRACVVLRAGWQWAGVEGPAEIAGPDDPMAGIGPERLR